VARNDRGMKVYSTKTGKPGFASVYSKFEQVKKQGERHTEEITREVALEIRRDTRQNIRTSLETQTGQLARSAYLKKRRGSNPTYEVGVRADYAEYTEFGTGIYNIFGRGRTEPWKYFSKNTNRWVSTRGQEANLYFNDALESNLGRFPDRLRKKIRGNLA